MRYVLSYTHNKYFIWQTVLILLIFTCQTYAQFPQAPDASSITTIKSPLNNNVTVSFKSPAVGTCSTVFSTQKQFSGYVHLPPDILRPSQGNFSINTFFWFIEARQVPENAPLTVFINGGPGSSSMVGLFQEVGPCEVVEVARNRLGTLAREWGWDRSSNMLFVDQPDQVGYSFDVPTNGTMDLLRQLVSIPPLSPITTPQQFTLLNGTFSSDNPSSTANTSEIAAQSMWHFLQTFLAAFPEYNQQSRTGGSRKQLKQGVHIFTESYGGKYAPAIAKFFRRQNNLRKTDSAFANVTLEIGVATLGIINGWIDLLTQAPFAPRYAYNNSYGISAISQVQQLNALSSFSGADGCRSKTLTCRAQAAGFDPLSSGTSDLVNDICSKAAAYCQGEVIAPYLSSGRSIYDISQPSLDSFPSSFYLEYLNHPEVQKAIGVPVNYTQSSHAVGVAFDKTGDYARDGALDDLVEALNTGTRVALIYGDRDYVCNVLGGEAVSFAIAGKAGPAYRGWYSAGYAPIVTNSSYIGGVVREYGNLSFSRIYDAGHLVPAYQPETAFTVFARTIQGIGISLGNEVDLSGFSSSGNPNLTYKNTAPAQHDPKCFMRAVNATCNADQRSMLATGSGTIINGVIYKAESDWIPPPVSLVSMAGFPGTAPGSLLPNPGNSAIESSSVLSGSGGGQQTATLTRLPTGVYTATEIPSAISTTTSSGAAPARSCRSNSASCMAARFVTLVVVRILTSGFVG